MLTGAKHAIALAGIACMLGTAACGDESSESESSTADGEAAHVGKRVGIVVPESGPGYYMQMACGARDEGGRLGFEVDRSQAPAKQQDAGTQIRLLNAVLARDPDALVYAPVDANAGVPPIKAAVASGLKVANVDVELADPSLVVTFVSSSHAEGGAVAADLIAEQMGEGKVITVGVLPDNPITEGRVDGFEGKIREHSGIEYVGVRYPELDIGDITAEGAAILRRYPDLAGIYTTNDTVAAGLGTALREAGRAGEVKMVTWDAQPAGLKLLRAGTASGSIVQKPREMGKIAAQQLANAFDGKPTQKSIEVDFVTMTSDNVDTPESKALYYDRAC